MINVNEMSKHYAICALWSSADFDGNPLDADYSISDIDTKTSSEMHTDCADFVKQSGKLLEGLNVEQIGHDFWLTRNHHGAGFWDRGLGAIGEELTKIANAFGSVDLYVTDNGEIAS